MMRSCGGTAAAVACIAMVSRRRLGRVLVSTLAEQFKKLGQLHCSFENGLASIV